MIGQGGAERCSSCTLPGGPLLLLTLWELLPWVTGPLQGEGIRSHGEEKRGRGERDADRPGEKREKGTGEGEKMKVQKKGKESDELVGGGEEMERRRAGGGEEEGGKGEASRGGGRAR